jgi:hypothetical protein
MRTYVVMVARDPLTGEPDIRCRSDIDTHPQFKRANDFVTFRKTDGTKTIYTVLYEGEESVCKKFKETLQGNYTVADLEMYGGMTL